MTPPLVQGKSGGKLKAATFDDELELFSGQQDLNTIVRSDFKGHDQVGVVRHKPKDQIEVCEVWLLFFAFIRTPLGRLS